MSYLPQGRDQVAISHSPHPGTQNRLSIDYIVSGWRKLQRRNEDKGYKQVGIIESFVEHTICMDDISFVAELCY